MNLSLTEEYALADISKFTGWLAKHKPAVTGVTIRQRQYNAIVRIERKARAAGEVLLRDGSVIAISINDGTIKYNGFILTVKRPIKKCKPQTTEMS